MKKGVIIFLVSAFILIALVYAAPLIDFTSQSPSNATLTTNTSLEINTSIIEGDLMSLIYSWNGTNFTMYDDSLILMMNFDDYARLNDTSIYGNNGSCTNCPTFNSAGKYNGAYNFDGSNDYIQIPHSDLLSINDKISIGFWFKSNVPSDDSQIIIAKPKTSSDYIGDWWFEASKTGSEFRFYLKQSDGTNHNLNVNAVLDDSWHYILGTYNGTTQSIYIDGSLNNTVSWAGTFINYNQPIYIGKQFTDTSYGDVWFDGTLDELRIWNRSLSSDEVYQQYVSNLNKFNSTQWYLYINQSKNATTELDYGSYTYQAFAKNSSGDINSTGQRTLTIKSDIINPELNVSNITIDEGSSVGVLFNASDSSGLSFWWINDTTNFKINQSGYFENNSVLADENYSVSVSVNDTENNIVSEIIVVMVVAVSVEEVEETTSSSSSMPIIQMGKVKEKMFSGELRYGYRANFEVKNESHRLYLRGINRDNGAVNFDVYSEKQSIEVKIGEEKELDLDLDGTMDVLLKVNSISKTNTAVNLELGEIAVEDIKVVDEIYVDENENENENIKLVSYMSYIIGLIVAILSIILLFLFFKRSDK